MNYDRKTGDVALSVRELCAEATASPHLDLRAASPYSAERARLGREAHRLLQDRVEQGFSTEVTLEDHVTQGGVSFFIKGRADCVWERDDRLAVEEIKSVSSGAFLREPTAFHTAQALVYAHLLCQKHGVGQIEVRLTMVRLQDGAVRTVTSVWQACDLKKRYEALLEGVLWRASRLRERAVVRIASVEHAHFPFSSVRRGQDLMIRECYRDIKAGKRLFIQAPTGTGKTLSALYPAVRALGDGHCDKIFYLTAKASTAAEAYRAAASLFEAGARLRTITLTAKDPLCVNEAAKSDPRGISGHCNPDACPRAKDFHKRCRMALEDILDRQSGYPRSTVVELARQYEICPYELQLALSEFCDVVICDYNYVFDPAIRLRRYFEKENDAENGYVFLVDEAHNLADRACQMHSAEMTASTVSVALDALCLSEDATETATSLKESLHALKKELERVRTFCADTITKDENGIERGYYLSSNPLYRVDEAVNAARADLDRWSFLHRGEDLELALTGLSVMLRRYARAIEFYDSQFLTFAEVNGEETTVRLICLDPSRLLENTLKKAKASVLFSATLTPIDYFADLLGGGKEAIKLSLPSPFDPKNVCVVAATGVSARYEDRAKNAKRIASHIAAVASARAGNYIFYFPSYDYMEQVHAIFCEKNPKVETVLQERGMSAARRDRFLDAFSGDDRLRIGFCVLGGSFSEGVDLPGERLIGVGVVGVGLPGISNERNILKEYYDRTREAGYDYAYTFPGMNRVLQAAGRLIRREDDRGVIVLMDDRYAEPRYRTLLPEQWSHLQYATKATELANLLAVFWSETDRKTKK